MKIKRCVSGDAAAVAKIERDCIECPWSEKEIENCIRSDDYAFFKASSDGETLGYIGVQIVAPEFNVCNVAVIESARRRGVATALVGEVVRFALEKGGGTLYLEVNEFNVGAIALYEKLGFVVYGRRPRYYGDAAAILMKKET